MRKKKVLIVDDDKLIRWSLRQKLTEWGFKVYDAQNGDSGIQLTEEETPDLILLDVKLPDIKGTHLLRKIKKNWPDLPVVMMTAFGIIDDAVTAMKDGAYDFIIKPIDNTKLQSTIKNALETASLKKEIAYYKEKERKQFDPGQIVAASPPMQNIMDMIQTIAKSEATIVLLQGESGTGKDLLAQAIHHLSRRQKASYLAINCSAIPENLLESELFGYEKGAFTDAKHQKKGLVELADEGTLFLDEVSTLSLQFQAKLLRFLETQTFKRVGGLKDIFVDIRLIAATNQDLEQAYSNGTFRKDLYFRLNVCPVFIPPLRKRRDDIRPLAQHFIRFYNMKFRKNIQGLEGSAENLILQYNWPGNVRELRNAIERAMIFEEGPHISTAHLPIHLDRDIQPHSLNSEEHSRNGDLSLPKMEKTLLLTALKKAKGNKTRAAKFLHITRDTLRYKIKKFQIQKDDF